MKTNRSVAEAMADVCAENYIDAYAPAHTLGEWSDKDKLWLQRCITETITQALDQKQNVIDVLRGGISHMRASYYKEQQRNGTSTRPSFESVLSISDDFLARADELEKI